MSFKSSFKECVLNRLFSVQSVYQPLVFQLKLPLYHCKVKLFQLYCFSSGQDYGLFILTFPWWNTKMTQIRVTQIILEVGNISAFSVSKHVILTLCQGHWLVSRYLLLNTYSKYLLNLTNFHNQNQIMEWIKDIENIKLGKHWKKNNNSYQCFESTNMLIASKVRSRALIW